MTDIAIRVENLSKLYRIGQLESYKTLRESLTNVMLAPFRAVTLRRQQSKIGRMASNNTIWALKDVSFEVKQGEAVGIIGRNGAGKTTLLKILTRITTPTEGYAEIRGRVGSLLEVGTGFHPELTGRENIYLNGAVLGMKRKEIDRRFDEIVDFSGVEKFIDTPLKRYSTGMQVRLAFAVAAHLEPEILLIDEVLAVGDVEFQKKCLGKMEDVARGGRTVLFVSHNLSAVEKLCGSAMLLDTGQKVCQGPVDEVVSLYLRSFVNQGGSGEIAPSMHRVNTGELWIDRVTLTNSNGEPVTQLRIAEPFTVTILFEVRQPIQGVRIGLVFDTTMGTHIATVHHTDEGLELFNADSGVYEISFNLVNPLLPGTYLMDAGAHRALGVQAIEYVPEALKFDVVELSADGYVHPKYAPGLIRFRGEWKPAQRIQ
jgi:lipopolysaccharide transport system ATP-binding protein